MSHRVLALIQGETVAASRYRVLQYLPYLESRGMVCEVRCFPDNFSEYGQLLKDLPDYDTVFVQRKRFHFPYLEMFRRRAGRVVFDLDDALMYKNSLSASPYSRTRERRFARMVRACDAVIAGNSFLAEKSRPYCKDVRVVPSSIPAEKYRLKDYEKAKDKVTIGWIGDHGSIHYLEKMIPVWDEIARRFPGQVELKIICDTFFECEVMPVKKVQWAEDTEVDELRDMDLGVMPLIDDPWSWGKCGLKILQYFGVGIPAVCTPVGVNRDVVRDGENGYWAMGEAQWVAKIALMVEDAAKRKRMGLAGRATLDAGYTREVSAPKIYDILRPQGD